MQLMDRMGRLQGTSDEEDPGDVGEVLADLEGQEDAHSGSEGPAEDVEEVERDDSYHRFAGHSESVFSVAWNPVDRYCVASGGQDETAYLWRSCSPDETNDQLPFQTLEGHSDSIIAVAFNHDGTFLATAAMDGKVKIWSMDGALVHTLEGPSDAITWMCWHPAGNVVLAGAGDFMTWMWNAQTGACMQVFSGHNGTVSCGAFAPDGRSVITAGDDEDRSLKVWNPRNAECTLTVSGHNFHEGGINCLDISSDGQLCLTGSADCTARLTNLSSAHPVGSLTEHQDSVESVRFTTGVFQVIVTGSLDGKAMAWDRGSLAHRQTFEHQSGVVCMEAIKDVPIFVTGCMDGGARIWDARLRSCIKEMHGGSDPVQCLALDRDELLLMTGSDDSSVRIFDMRV